MTRCEGRKQIDEKLQKNPKAAYVPNYMITSGVAMVQWTLENMKPRWDHAWRMRRLQGDEGARYRDKKNWTPAEKERFSGPKPRYTSGKGIKRELGKDLRSEEGKARLRELQLLWKRGMEDDRCRTALAVAWQGWTLKTGKCKSYELIEEERIEDLMEVGEGARNEVAPVVLEIPESECMYMDDMPPLEGEDGGGGEGTSLSSPSKSRGGKRGREESGTPSPARRSRRKAGEKPEQPARTEEV